MIPAGSASAPITVTPIDDAASEGDETVVATLSSSASYTVGSPSAATVTIAGQRRRAAGDGGGDGCECGGGWS